MIRKGWVVLLLIVFFFGFGSDVFAQNLICRPQDGMGCSPGQSCYGRNKLNRDTIVITNNKSYTVTLEAIENLCTPRKVFDNLSDPTWNDWNYQCNSERDRYLYCLAPGQTVSLRVEVPNNMTGQIDIEEKNCSGGSCGCYDENNILWQGGLAYTIWSNNTGVDVPLAPAPCTSDQVTGMAIRNPANGTNIFQVGDTVDFVLGGCQGDQYYSNNCAPDGGNLANHGSTVKIDNCDPWRFWAPDNVTAYIALAQGDYTWTRSWRNCRDDNTAICGPTCSKTLPYRVMPPLVTGPKTCSVNVGSTRIGPNENLAITVSGIGNSLGEPVRMYVENGTGTTITSLSGYPIHTSGGTGTNYYLLGTCTYSSAGSPCTISRTLSDLPLGNYFVHCDLPNNPPNPGPSAYKCSGNPYCPPPPTGIGITDSAIAVSRENCDGWLSCSSTDVRKFTVANSPPSVVSFGLQGRNAANTSETWISSDPSSGNFNQVCDDDFVHTNDDKRMGVYVRVDDEDGLDNIDLVEVYMDGGSNNYIKLIAQRVTTGIYNFSIDINPDGSFIESGGAATTFWTSPGYSDNSNGRRFFFPVQFLNTSSFSSYNLSFKSHVRDLSGAWNVESTSGGWPLYSHNRNLKVWDCNVSVSGSLYDQAGIEGVCPSSAIYANLFETSYALTYQGVGTANKVMSVTATVNPQYISGANPLKWGKTYQASFGSIDGSPPTNPRFDDLGRSGESIPCNMTFTINNSVVDPYSANTSLRVDYTSLMNQDPWFQVQGGGVVGVGNVISKVPATCSGSCIPALSIDALSSKSGLVASGGALTGAISGKTYYSLPSNWYASGLNMVDNSYGYDFFYNRFHVRLGKGHVKIGDATSSEIFGTDYGLASLNILTLQSFALLDEYDMQTDSAIGEDGDPEVSEIVFVTGDLTIDSDISFPNDRFVLVVVGGNINIQSNVLSLQGVYVSDGNISASGTSDSPLIIDGILFSKGGVSFTRGYTVTSENNMSPAVVVRYNSKYVFGMSGDIKEAISWYYGD